MTGRLPSEHPEVAPYPAVHRLLATQADLQFQDLRILFRLPHHALDPDVGCNYTVAAILVNQISGFSQWFFHNRYARRLETEEKKRKSLLTRRRFMGFLRAYLPRQPDDIPIQTIADRLYQLRNLFVHELGFGELPKDPAKRRIRGISIAKPKPALPQESIALLETSETRPSNHPLFTRKGMQYTLHTQTLYWATHRMLCRSLQEHGARADAQADTYFAALPQLKLPGS